MQKVLVIGPGGAGKTTLARRIAGATGLPLIHLDSLYWRPGWQPTPAAEWEELVSELTSRPRWVMDGNYGGTLDARIAAADTIVFLDWPRLHCIWRVIRRRVEFAGRSRPSMPDDCPERLTVEFIRWIWDYPRRRRPRILERLERVRNGKHVIVLRDRAGVQAFLDGLAGVRC
jgi:adenylate kinase family enzyme